MFEYRLEHVMSFYINAQFPEMIGPIPEGIQLNFYITGGEISGPKVVGKVRPVGGDWMTVRRDGVAILDIKGTLETQDGALIYATLDGTFDFGRSCGVGIRRVAPHFGLRLALEPLTRTIYGSTAVTLFLLARHLRSGFASNTRFMPCSRLAARSTARPSSDRAGPGRHPDRPVPAEDGLPQERQRRHQRPGTAHVEC